MFDDREYKEPELFKPNESEPVSVNMRVAMVLVGVILLGTVAYLANPKWEPGLIWE